MTIIDFFEYDTSFQCVDVFFFFGGLSRYGANHTHCSFPSATLMRGIWSNHTPVWIFIRYGLERLKIVAYHDFEPSLSLSRSDSYQDHNRTIDIQRFRCFQTNALCMDAYHQHKIPLFIISIHDWASIVYADNLERCP